MLLFIIIKEGKDFKYMGAWGYGNLENDTILDWIGELIETDDINLISDAIDMVLEDSYLDADTSSIAIGAIEVLAALNNNPLNELYDEDLEEWINQHNGQGKNLLVPAQRALKKILKESELKELWQESDDYDNWVSTLKELENRITI